MLLLGVLAIIVVIVYVYLKRRFSFWERNGVKQLRTNCLLGSFFEVFLQRKTFAEITKENYDAFKGYRYFGMYKLHVPVLLLRDPELIKDITVKDFDSFSNHEFYARKDVDDMWSRNIASLTGERWHDMRTILSPAFTACKMRAMFSLTTDCAERFVQYFVDQNEDLVQLEMKDTFARATNDMIASCAFGVQCDSLRDRQNEFFVKGRKAFYLGFARKMMFFMFTSCPSLMKFLGLKIFSDEITSFFRSIIKETIAMREKGIFRPDMIQLLLDARAGTLKMEVDKHLEESFASTKEYSFECKRPKREVHISDDDITAQALVFYFGGFDSSSYLTGFIAYELAINPDIQQRVMDEVEHAFESCGGRLTFEAVQKMKYLDMVVTETLRKWPVSIVLDRMCNKDYTIEPQNDGERPVTIKKGSVVWIPIYGLHRDPEYYPDPEKFDPERFNEENRENINKFTYLPFGSGPRNCIGSRFVLMENKTLICHLLRRFEIVPVAKTQIPIKPCTKNFNISVKDGMWLGFKRRRNEAIGSSTPIARGM